MYQDLTQRFVDLLLLKRPPVGLAFVDTIPDHVKHVGRRVPSACTFWKLAEQGIFYAAAEDHQECPIGLMTMGFEIGEESQQRAQDLVQTMASVQYFSPLEVSSLPVVEKPHRAIVYGRLDRFPGDADVVLCILRYRAGHAGRRSPGQCQLVAAVWTVGHRASYLRGDTSLAADRVGLDELWLCRRTHLYRSDSR